jgi:predicted transcriptional regulator
MPRCVYVVKYILPALRASLAKELFNKGFKIKEIAEMLGLTQAAVSQYLSSKRGQKGLEIIERNENAREVILELVELIVQRKASINDENQYLCKICEILELKGKNTNTKSRLKL